MLTSAKLIGGIFLAITAVYSSYLIIRLNTSFYLSTPVYLINAVIGYAVGWRAIGSNPGVGGAWLIINGLRGVFIYAILSAVTYGGWVILLKLQKFFIKKFQDILTGWFDAVIDYFVLLAAPDVILTLVVGGCISGIGAGLANRYWS